ncbi:hypothetical protein [Marinicellulosiphila megalodicopiae]|uniref:hypothetical protein n=1 Tax=Marinicellulosiphila megalodicopiae TaxID=2724896 RepID=UPI003BAE5A8F
MRVTHSIKSVIFLVFLCVSLNNQAVQNSYASEVLGKTLIFQIESVKGANKKKLPSKGVYIQTYDSNVTYQFKTLGANINESGINQYKYEIQSPIIAIETTFDQDSKALFKTSLKFDSATSGKWERVYGDYQTIIRGHFVVESKNILAPKSQINRTNALTILKTFSNTLPRSNYPDKGSIFLQMYQSDGTFNGTAFGPRAFQPEGSYSATRVSNNTVIEHAVSNIKEINYSAPYTMVYFYDTDYSGTWYQNFNNGLITLSGTFTTFESK